MQCYVSPRQLHFKIRKPFHTLERLPYFND
jgi:hypothetical protein